MRRLCVGLVAFVLLLTLTACQTNLESDPSSSQTTESTTTTTESSVISSNLTTQTSTSLTETTVSETEENTSSTSQKSSTLRTTSSSSKKSSTTVKKSSATTKPSITETGTTTTAKKSFVTRPWTTTTTTRSKKSRTTTTTTTAPTKPSRPKDVWDGKYEDKFAGGNGTKASPYVIKTAQQFALFADEVNVKAYEDRYVYFSLESDIDLASIPWTPIGSYSCPFRGHFEGNGHAIHNLNVTKAHIDSDKSVVVAGLFGAIQDSEIRNLGIETATINISPSWETDYNYIGTLCGYLSVGQKDTKLSSCYVMRSKIEVPDTSVVICAGGVAGFIYLTSTADCSLEKVESHSTLVTENAVTIYDGGIAGSINIKGSGRVTATNFCSYVDSNKPEKGDKYIGAFGQLYTKGGRVTLRDGYTYVGFSSKGGERGTITYYGISSEIYVGGKKNLMDFENIYSSRSLYPSDMKNYINAQNLHYSVAVPEGLWDDELWDLTNPHRPRLIF